MKTEIMTSREKRIDRLWTGVVALATMAPAVVALWVHYRTGGGGSDYVYGWAQMLPVLAASAIVLLLCSIFRHRTVGRMMPKAAMATVALVVMAEIVMGLLQLAGVAASRHAGYAVTGTFYNPGPYGGLVAMVMPVGVAVYFATARRWRYAGLALVMLAVLVLPASGSRTAWISAAVSCGFVFACYRPQTAWRWAKRYGWIAVLVAVGIGIWLYWLKIGSANGRVFMWSIGLKAIAEHPWGVGWWGVPGAYGDAQEAYFGTGLWWWYPEQLVADAPGYLFNEYLQVALAWGIVVALALTALLCVSVVRAVRLGRMGVAGATVSLMVFALASYPLQFPVFVALLAVLVMAAYAPDDCGRGRRLFMGLCVAVASVSLWAGCLHAGMDRERSRWDSMRYLYRAKQYGRSVERTGGMLEDMDWNSHYLFELGHSLNHVGRYGESNDVLRRAVKVSSDPMPLNVMGRNYEALGMVDSALAIYQRAAYRVPNRLYPYYLMIKLASDPAVADTMLLRKVGLHSLCMRVKVESPAIGTMRNEMKDTLINYKIIPDYSGRIPR